MNHMETLKVAFSTPQQSVFVDSNSKFQMILPCHTNKHWPSTVKGNGQRAVLPPITLVLSAASYVNSEYNSHGQTLGAFIRVHYVYRVCICERNPERENSTCRSWAVQVEANQPIFSRRVRIRTAFQKLHMHPVVDYLVRFEQDHDLRFGKTLVIELLSSIASTFWQAQL